MQRDELIHLLRDSGTEALAAMAAVPEERLDAEGYEQGWNVKQIMAHVASMEYTYRRLPDLARGNGDAQTTSGGGAFDMDGYNARQVQRRADSSQADLIEEFTGGRAVLLVEISGLDEALLATPVRSAGGGTGSLAHVIEETAAQHAGTHSADFARAAGAMPSFGERAAAALLLAAAELRVRLDGVTRDRWTRKRSAADWSAAGIAGHLIEMMPYWAIKAATVARDPSVPFGRAIDSPERIGAVVDGERLTPSEAVAAADRAAAEAAQALRGLDRAAGSISVTGRPQGPTTLEHCVDSMLVHHAREHLEQIAAALAGSA